MALFGTEEAIPACVNWPKVFADAGINGVSAICYEAVKRLPEDRQPDFDLMLRWDLSAQEIREGFHHRHEVTQKLRSLLEGKGFSMLLLKGETLADYYPQPDLRESGDVDFIALPDPAGCIDFISSLGITVVPQKTHTSFVYEGIHFESHPLELEEAGYEVDRKTFKMLKEAQPDNVVREDGCLELAPVIQAVFTVKHISQHANYMGGRVSVRMLLDLALLLRRHGEILNEWEPELRQTGLYRFSRILLCTIDRLFGTRFRNGRNLCRRLEAKCFSYIFLTDSKGFFRSVIKFAFLPLRTSEFIRVLYEKAGRTLTRRTE